MTKQVVILSPSRYSLYTICVTELLRRQDIQIASIFVRRLFNPSRFISEFGRDGSRLVRKIWKKLVLRDKAYGSRDYETMVTFMERESISYRKVDDFKDRVGIPVIYCKDLNDPVVVESLKEIRPELVVFTGGGLVREDVLKSSGAGVLNCHSGVLPTYRGMDVVEWPILEGNMDQVGMTVHFMDKGIDTGGILRVRKVNVGPQETIAQLRERMEPIMCQEIVLACLDHLDGRLERQVQKLEDGKQYFVMHPRLVEISESKLAAGHSIIN